MANEPQVTQIICPTTTPPVTHYLLRSGVVMRCWYCHKSEAQIRAALAP
jgi:hypothetical protein